MKKPKRDKMAKGKTPYIPPEIIGEIFQHLPEFLLWTTCRQVSRTFKTEADLIIRRKCPLPLTDFEGLTPCYASNHLHPRGLKGSFRHVGLSADKKWAYFEANLRKNFDRTRDPYLDGFPTLAEERKMRLARALTSVLGICLTLQVDRDLVPATNSESAPE